MHVFIFYFIQLCVLYTCILHTAAAHNNVHVLVFFNNVLIIIFAVLCYGHNEKS